MNLAEHFHHPEAWPLLLLVPALLGFLAWRDARREGLLRRTCGARTAALTSLLHRGRRRGRRWLAGAGALLALLAFLQPVGGPSPDLLVQEDSDLVFCLDVSRSMLARDQRPDRLQAARQLLREWALEHPGGRLGLVLFAGEARLVMPLTRDRESFLALVEQAGPEQVPQGGTNLRAALEAAYRCVPPDSDSPATVLLLTDGEDHSGAAQEAAERLHQADIRLHCIGWGTERGSKIPVPGRVGETYLRDRQGAEVLSAMDAESLTRLAAVCGGEFLAAARVLRPLEDLHQRGLLSGGRRQLPSGVPPLPGNRYQWPLLGAILAWVLELCWSDRRSP